MAQEVKQFAMCVNSVLCTFTGEPWQTRVSKLNFKFINVDGSPKGDLYKKPCSSRDEA